MMSTSSLLPQSERSTNLFPFTKVTTQASAPPTPRKFSPGLRPSGSIIAAETKCKNGAGFAVDFPWVRFAHTVMPFDDAELEGFTAMDAREVFGMGSKLQVGALDYFIAEAQRLDPDWPGLKEEHRARLAEWAATPVWERASKRRKKSWAEKGMDFLLCGIRCRVVKHRDESGCIRTFTVPEYCRMRGCPRCGEKQADDFYNKWIPRLLGVAKYHPMGARPGKRWGYEFYHVTLTSRKSGERPTPAESTVLWKDFLRKAGLFCHAFYPGSLGKSELFPKRDGCGALIQGEVGRNKDGTANWNQHAHIIVFGPYTEVSTMKAFWTELTGASGYGVHVQRLGNDPEVISQTLRHMFKYYKKPFSYDPKTYVETVVGMAGVRLRRATGIFYRDQRGSTWADRVADWESCARAELEALGRIPERVLRCFDCGEVLVPDYRRGLLWRTQALERGYADYERARASRGPPRLIRLTKALDDAPD